jgi:4-hydroxybenzoate polyprenyltransferase
LLEGATFSWPAIVMIAVGVFALYIGGMALNDVVDAAFDTEANPARPIPSGRISRGGALAIATVALSAGIALCGAVTLAGGGAAVGLAAVIVLYNLVHKRTVHAVWLMGACRGLVYVVAALALALVPAWPAVAAGAGAMTLYIAGITFAARGEHLSEAATTHRASWRHAALLVVLLPALVVRPETWWPAIVAGVAVIAMVAVGGRSLRSTPPRIGDAVMMWLAGICLVDAYFLTLLDEPVLAVVAAACFVLTRLGHRFIRGT